MWPTCSTPLTTLIHFVQIDWYERVQSRKKCNFFYHGATVASGPGPPHYRGFTITLKHGTLGRTPLDECSRPDNAQRTQLTHIHAFGGILNRNPSKREAADPSLRPRGLWS